jgi:hypothetical protein
LHADLLEQGLLLDDEQDLEWPQVAWWWTWLV